jgi:hypothetical protein
LTHRSIRTRFLLASLTTVLALFAGAGCPAPLLPRPCPSAERSAAAAKAATYAVVIEMGIPQGNDQHVLTYAGVGAAFAVAEKRLATTAHVVDAILGETPFPIQRVLALHVDTGATFVITHAAKHPDYDGDPTLTPDVALLTTEESLPSFLALANAPALEDLSAGDELLIAGVSGDNATVFALAAGQTPVGASAEGAVAAIRDFAGSIAPPAPDAADLITHAFDATIGFDGAPLIACGRIVGVNTAGGASTFVTVASDGKLQLTRATIGNLSVGVHVRHLRYLLDADRSGILFGTFLPPPLVPPGGVADLSSNSGGVGGQVAAANYGGAATGGNRNHTLTLTISTDGAISGVSTFPNDTSFGLTGVVEADGTIRITDGSPVDPGFYIGRPNPDGTISGTYTEQSEDQPPLATWTAVIESAAARGMPTPNLSGLYAGRTSGAHAAHEFDLRIRGNQIAGNSRWRGATFQLTGVVRTDGTIVITDNAQASGLPRGLYVGEPVADGLLNGVFGEPDLSNVIGGWTADRN